MKETSILEFLMVNNYVYSYEFRNSHKQQSWKFYQINQNCLLIS